MSPAAGANEKESNLARVLGSGMFLIWSGNAKTDDADKMV